MNSSFDTLHPMNHNFEQLPKASVSQRGLNLQSVGANKQGFSWKHWIFWWVFLFFPPHSRAKFLLLCCSFWQIALIKWIVCPRSIQRIWSLSLWRVLEGSPPRYVSTWRRLIREAMAHRAGAGQANGARVERDVCHRRGRRAAEAQQ